MEIFNKAEIKTFALYWEDLLVCQVRASSEGEAETKIKNEIEVAPGISQYAPPFVRMALCFGKFKIY